MLDVDRFETLISHKHNVLSRSLRSPHLLYVCTQALGEFSDLEALRKEKRAIMDEEQRLKALLTLEKVCDVCMLRLYVFINTHMCICCQYIVGCLLGIVAN